MYVIINLMHLVSQISGSQHSNGLLLDFDYSYTHGPGYNEKKYAVVLSDFIYLVIVTEQITYIEDTCYQVFYLLIRYNQVRVTRARVY